MRLSQFLWMFFAIVMLAVLLWLLLYLYERFKDKPPVVEDKELCVKQHREHGDHVCDQVVTDYSDLTPEQRALAETRLTAAGFRKIKDCLCNTIALWDASAVEDIDLNDQTQTAKDKAGIQNDSLKVGFNLVIAFPPVTREFRVTQEGDFNKPDPSVPKPRKVLAAIIDTGIDPNHPMLQPFLWNNPAPGAGCLSGDVYGYDFLHNQSNPIDSNGHGTHLAGILALNFPDSIGLEIMALKFHDGTNGLLFDAICAMHYAIDKGAQIINLSWGYNSANKDALLENALKRAQDKGILVTASAGNEGQDNSAPPHWPSNFSADFDNFVAVASNDGVGALSSFSNRSATLVNLAAMGEWVTSTYLNNQYADMRGTSMSAAQVSRTFALLRAMHPSEPHQKLMNCVLGSVYVPPAPLPVSTGGILNDTSAINACMPPTM
jgi:hypothetical protein